MSLVRVVVERSIKSVVVKIGDCTLLAKFPKNDT